MENKDSRHNIARSAGKVSLGTLASRVFGLIREQVFAYLFGAGMSADSFVAAFRIPNLLRDMFAEGALSAAFVPTLSEKLARDKRGQAFKLARTVFTFLLIVVSLISLVGIIFAPHLVDLIAGGFEDVPGKIELTITLARIMIPFLLLVSLAAVFMGVLNALGIFGVPAFAPTMVNLAMIASGFLICPFFDPPIIGMAIGVILGGLGQLLFQVPVALRQGFVPSLDFSFNDPAFKKIILLMMPMAVGFSATQINVFIVTRLAASLQEGAVAYLNYAFRLMHLPLGLFALAIATVSLPRISRFAALDKKEDMAGAYLSSLKLGLFLVLPASLVLIFGGGIIFSVLFQHGRFDYNDTLMASKALAFYAIGLAAYAAVRISVPVFYAFKETFKPIVASVVAVVVNIILCYQLMGPLGFKGLALAASISGCVNIGLLVLMLKMRLPQISLAGQFLPFAKIVMVNMILAVALFFFQRFMTVEVFTSSLPIRIFYLILLLAGSAILYLLFSIFLKIEQLEGLRSIFRKFTK